ncbi:MAG: GNAT family N-acetyltransferase [Pseudomonadota bacterium]|nr:GNAT family N-acetyltransferase [Pseudomonadota bacterium]
MPENKSENKPEKLNLTHVNSVFEIVEAHAQNPQFSSWKIEQVRSELQSGHGLGFLQNEKLIAFILYKAFDSHIEISLLATHPEREHQGLMRSLLGQVREFKPVREIWLEVHENNLRARQIYEKSGFFIVGRRFSYYPDGGAAILYNCL